MDKIQEHFMCYKCLDATSVVTLARKPAPLYKRKCEWCERTDLGRLVVNAPKKVEGK